MHHPTRRATARFIAVVAALIACCAMGATAAQAKAPPRAPAKVKVCDSRVVGHKLVGKRCRLVKAPTRVRHYLGDYLHPEVACIYIEAYHRDLMSMLTGGATQGWPDDPSRSGSNCDSSIDEHVYGTFDDITVEADQVRGVNDHNGCSFHSRAVGIDASMAILTYVRCWDWAAASPLWPHEQVYLRNIGFGAYGPGWIAHLLDYNDED